MAVGLLQLQEIKQELADRIHSRIGDAAEILDAHDLDEADIELLRRAAVYADDVFVAIQAAAYSVSKSHQ